MAINQFRKSSAPKVHKKSLYFVYQNAEQLFNDTEGFYFRLIELDFHVN